MKIKKYKKNDRFLFFKRGKKFPIIQRKAIDDLDKRGCHDTPKTNLNKLS